MDARAGGSGANEQPSAARSSSSPAFAGSGSPRGTTRTSSSWTAVYEVGGASSSDGKLVRHAGREFGLVLSGTLGVTVGFEEHVLGPGDSISFESTIPHRLHNDGDQAVRAIWVTLGRYH